MRIAFYGNCQSEAYGEVVKQALPDAKVIVVPTKNRPEDLRGADVLFVQTAYWDSFNAVSMSTYLRPAS